MKELIEKLTQSHQSMLLSRESMLDFLVKTEPGLTQMDILSKLAESSVMRISVHDQAAIKAGTLNLHQLIKLLTAKEHWRLLLESPVFDHQALPSEIRKLKMHRSEFTTEVREIQYRYMLDFDQANIDQVVDRLLSPTPRILQSSLLGILNKISRQSSETFATPHLAYTLHDIKQIPEFFDLIKQMALTFGKVLRMPVQLPQSAPVQTYHELLDSGWLQHDYRFFTIQQKENFENSFWIRFKTEYQGELDQYLAADF